jgi:hypothetical protein
MKLRRPDDVNALTAMYGKLEYSWQVYQPIFNGWARAAEYFTHTADVSTLLPAEINTEIDLRSILTAQPGLPH